jgi:hypothetical protein
MSPCTICSLPTSDDTDLCAWCASANFSGTEGRGIPPPWWVEARLPLAPRRDGLRALRPAPPMEETT